MLQCRRLSSDARAADAELQDGAPPRAFHHLGAVGRVEIDADLFDISNALGLQQAFGHAAVPQNAVIYILTLYRIAQVSFSYGIPACCDAAIPPDGVALATAMMSSGMFLCVNATMASFSWRLRQ
jgi:hypothetical protein